MPELVPCRKCRRLFNDITNRRICPACFEEEEELFHKVKDYIRDNRGATVSMVCAEFDIPQKVVQQWVREERLEFANQDGLGIACAACGTPISTGRYCEKCKSNMVDGLSSMYKTEPTKAPEPIRASNSQAKMRSNVYGGRK